jgi:hypothetical protein
MTTNTHRPLLEQARTLPPQQYSSGGCSNHPPQRDGEPMESYVPSSSVPPYSRPRAPRLSDAGSRLVDLHPRSQVKGRRQSTRTNEERGTSPHPSMTTSTTPMMRATSSTCVTGIRRTVLAMATTLVGAAAMIARRNDPRALSQQGLRSLAGISATRYFRHAFGNLPTSPNTPGK